MSYGGFLAAQDIEFKQDKVVSDECLTEIAIQLAHFVPLVGGASNSESLVDLVEKLATSAETCIRTGLVESLKTIIPEMARNDPSTVEALLLPMLKHIVEEEGFAGKCTAAGMCPIVYPFVADAGLRAAVREIFLICCNDDTPIIRKCAYENIGNMVRVVGSEAANAQFGPILIHLRAENQENLRLLCVDAAIQMAPGISEIDFKELCFPLAHSACQDSSWRVRKKLAKDFPELSKACGQAYTAKNLLRLYLDLLGDSENEVKLTAVKGIACLASCSSAGPFVDVLGAKLSALACDPQQQARSAFSEFVLDMCPSFGKELSVKILLPIILKFLDDDVSDMRVNVLEKLDMLVECVGVKDVVDAILPRVLSMSKDSKWRVRKSVVENISQLAESIGSSKFNETFKSVLFEAFKDKVYAVREAAAKQVPVLTKAFGTDWAIKTIFNELIPLYSSSKSVHIRIVPVIIVHESILVDSVIAAELFSSHLLPVLAISIKDTVPNILVLTLRTMKLASTKYGSASVSSLKAMASELANHADTDVKYCASRLLQ